MSVQKIIKESMYCDRLEHYLRFRGELKPWKEVPDNFKTNRVRKYYIKVKRRVSNMIIPKSTIEKYRAVSSLLYEIRHALFFTKIRKEDRVYLENYKVPLEQERSALFKAIETDQKFLTASEF
ncbi:hypothetical protein [Leptospira kirschneri]|uniref:Uncharacterized protein n=1 Tax=Leptospira kirschneri serovar Bulgarica str. Nikolaevo TaxID=1240687 RepID=M6FFS3_9LEPT|nr:hypothetical protein [Leptospira kirschneri]EMK22386.1 hypothetical protein LEP1GSC008_1557 [Leptospira kirschneri serovar Bulgarica str. Nikolaevo]EMK24558.1 hypothetical protein LEP1GSC008_2630 [Leptospira kirschneri serovar Bulgarica str. Nikolaevo]EMK24899.1 hypothetical protein LEP1GSC008_0600 [Leptospira kirschneri serovar Bulgarica str. Nikolaevo]